MIIGISGKAACGKTTAAKHIQSLVGESAIILPMAQALRREVEAFLRATDAEHAVPLLYGGQEDKVALFRLRTSLAYKACPQWGNFLDVHADIQETQEDPVPYRTTASIRRLLQWWGTEYRRAQDPDWWTKAWAQMVYAHNPKENLILVDDVRFVNELEMVKKLDGITLKIVRPGFNGANDHPSEHALDGIKNWNSVLINNEGLPEFREKVEQVFRFFQDRRNLPAA